MTKRLRNFFKAKDEQIQQIMQTVLKSYNLNAKIQKSNVLALLNIDNDKKTKNCENVNDKTKNDILLK